MICDQAKTFIKASIVDVYYVSVKDSRQLFVTHLNTDFKHCLKCLKSFKDIEIRNNIKQVCESITTTYVYI